MKLFYFTSTGNTLYLAKRLGGDLYSIPRLLKHESTFSYEADKIGILFPCYVFGVPRIVKEFIRRAKLRSDYCFAVMTYGNMSSAGVNNFYRIASKAGIRLSYLNEILMIDNYLPLFDMAAQKQDAPNKHIEEKIDLIISDIRSGKEHISRKGFAHTVFSYIIQKLYALNAGKVDSKYFVEDNCNGCKTCESVCPVDNIKVTGKPAFLHHCLECYGCTHHCPQNAIRVKNEKSRERFINEHITTKEIIESNR